MTIGSELYSDLYISKFIEKMRKTNTLCDGVLILIAATLLLIAGFSNILAVASNDNQFKKFNINQPPNAMFVALGAIYMLESVVLALNFLCCRNTIFVVIATVISFASFGIGIYRMIDMQEYKHFFVLFPLCADIIIIPILIYTACRSKKAMVHQEYVLLQDNNNNQVIVPKYNYDSNGKIPSKNSLLNDLNTNYQQVKLDTADIDIGEDDESRILSATMSGKARNKFQEDDEKAEELIMDTPGGNYGEIRISDDD